MIATHGRALYVLDDIAPCGRLAETMAATLHLFAIAGAAVSRAETAAPASPAPASSAGEPALRRDPHLLAERPRPAAPDEEKERERKEEERAEERQEDDERAAEPTSEEIRPGEAGAVGQAARRLPAPRRRPMRRRRRRTRRRSPRPRSPCAMPPAP